jgi:hypothetical protein
MSENAAPPASGQIGNGEGAAPMPTETTGSPLFAGLVWAHYRYERERCNKRTGPELDALEKTYSDKLKEFEDQAGQLDHVYWSTKEPSAVAMTVKDKPGKGEKWLGRLGLAEHDKPVSLHRVSDWVTTDTPKVANLLHDCDLLAIRVGEVLRGTPERIAMRWILGVEEHLLGFIERTKHLEKEARERAAPEKDLVKDQHAQLVAIERYYHGAASRSGRLVYITGMLMGLVPVFLLGALLGFLLWISGLWDREAELLVLCAGAGAIGALVSAISRMGKPEKGKFNVDFELGRPLIRRLGLYRPFLGSIFGVALYFLLESGIAQVDVSEDKQLYYYGFAAFLAGFSERFATVMFGTAERQLPDDSDVGRPDAEGDLSSDNVPRADSAL